MNWTTVFYENRFCPAKLVGYLHSGDDVVGVLVAAHITEYSYHNAEYVHHFVLEHDQMSFTLYESANRAIQEDAMFYARNGRLSAPVKWEVSR